MIHYYTRNTRSIINCQIVINTHIIFFSHVDEERREERQSKIYKGRKRQVNKIVRHKTQFIFHYRQTERGSGMSNMENGRGMKSNLL